MRVEHCFDPVDPDPRVARWVVYASEDVNVRGDEVATCSFEDRVARFEWREAHVWITVVGQHKDGTFQFWKDPNVLRSEVDLTGRTRTPPSPANAAVAHVDPSLMGRVIFDPPAQSEVGSYVQIIEGPSESLGKLLAEVPVRPRGPTFPDGARLPSESFPIEGGGVSTRILTVRGMGMAGNPATTPVTRTIAAPSRDQGYAIAVASVSGTTLSGFAAAGVSDGWEYDAVDGLRLRQIPTGAAITSDWGTPASGLLAGCGAFARYVDRAKVESNEIDLGATVTFCLEILDKIQRKSNAGGLTSVKAAALSWLPVAQIRDETRRGEATGPRWLARETRPAGTPRQPLRHCRWEYVVGTSSSVAHADADYIPYVPGQIVQGRYLRVRLQLREETGWHQIISPTITVRALVQRTVTSGSGTPESSVTAPPGSVYTRTNGPPHAYVKASGLGATGWVAVAERPLVYGDGSVPAGNTVAGTATATSFASTYTIPAGRLVMGSLLEVDLYGVLGTDVVAPTLILSVRVGGVIFVGTASVTMTAGMTALGWHMRARILVTAAGASGTAECHGDAALPTSATASLAVPCFGTSAFSIDTTVTEAIDARAQWGTSHVLNTVTLRAMTVKILDPA